MVCLVLIKLGISQIISRKLQESLCYNFLIFEGAAALHAPLTHSVEYNTLGSPGTRKCGGSPEPPPPPPRNANTDNNCSSSFNESKDSNEISEAECDQPRNYPGT